MSNVDRAQYVRLADQISNGNISIPYAYLLYPEAFLNPKIIEILSGSLPGSTLYDLGAGRDAEYTALVASTFEVRSYMAVDKYHLPSLGHVNPTDYQGIQMDALLFLLQQSEKGVRGNIMVNALDKNVIPKSPVNDEYIRLLNSLMAETISSECIVFGVLSNRVFKGLTKPGYRHSSYPFKHFSFDVFHPT